MGRGGERVRVQVHQRDLRRRDLEAAGVEKRPGPHPDVEVAGGDVGVDRLAGVGRIVALDSRDGRHPAAPRRKPPSASMVWPVTEALAQLVRGPAGVDRPRVDRVDGDAAVGEFVGERARRPLDGGLAEHVWQLARHRPEVLAGSEEDDPPVGTGIVVALPERLRQQHRGAGVDGPRPVEFVGSRGVERLIGAVSVVTTTASMLPNFVTVRSITRRAASGSPRSASTAATVSGSPSSSARTASSAVNQWTMTLTPSLSSRFAIANPIPSR
jgi:hypothetical protein